MVPLLMRSSEWGRGKEVIKSPLSDQWLCDSSVLRLRAGGEHLQHQKNTAALRWVCMCFFFSLSQSSFQALTDKRPESLFRTVFSLVGSTLQLELPLVFLCQTMAD